MNWALFFVTLCMVESSNNPNAIGDRNLAQHAYGIAQIRSMYLQDVVTNERGKMLATYGRILTLADMKDPKKAEWVVWEYTSHYGKIYQQKTGKAPTYEVLARIHNGGPNGWKRKNTDVYWKRFSKELNKRVVKAKR